jgi:hypothetical protein
MKKNLSSILATSLFLCVSFAMAYGQTLKRVVTKTDKLDFGAGGTVAIVGAPTGSIRVESAERNEIEIDAEITLEAQNEADLSALESVTTFVMDESLGRVAISSVGANDTRYLKRIAKKFPRRLVGLPFQIDYVIKVPRYCDLQIDGGKGDISISGVEGAIRLTSQESNTKIDLVGGALNATIGKGKVSVTIPNRSWRGSGIDIALANGEMDVYFPVNVSAELDASILRTGKIENSLLDLKPRIRTVKFTDTSISARSGNGGVPMKFTVGDGTLRLLTLGKERTAR